MADTKTKLDVEAAAQDTKDKAAETLDAAATTAQTAKDAVKTIFSKAIDDAKAAAVAGASAIGKKAHEQGEAYREKLAAADLLGEAKALGHEAKERAAVLATDGKAKASDALTGLGKLVADNALFFDDKLGEKYGDYARSAARAIQETAAKLESKDLAELGEEARSFVRKNPALAVGITAVVSFLVARTLTGSSKNED
ncbi:MAG: hypothetical protein KGJ57_07860 [Sphingomonadales bacterium]|nr:hypothetical protein [Sphingomonadales bacterium]MDE2169328.1 hypothetical protein [Sphingomonadales bacterium]